jgi:hypothetical protein
MVLLPLACSSPFEEEVEMADFKALKEKGNKSYQAQNIDVSLCFPLCVHILRLLPFVSMPLCLSA